MHLLNSPQVRSYAHGLAKRIAPDEKVSFERAIGNAHRITLSREATSDEVKDGVEFLIGQLKSYSGKSDARHLALTDYCQTLMCLNEFVYVE